MLVVWLFTRGYWDDSSYCPCCINGYQLKPEKRPTVGVEDTDPKNCHIWRLCFPHLTSDFWAIHVSSQLTGYIYVCIYIYIYICACVAALFYWMEVHPNKMSRGRYQVSCLHGHIHVHIHVHMHVHIHAHLCYIYVFIHVYIYTFIHVYIYHIYNIIQTICMYICLLIYIDIEYRIFRAVPFKKNP